MRNQRLLLLTTLLVSTYSFSQSASTLQNAHSTEPNHFEGSKQIICEGEGLDAIIVEKYYVSDAKDAGDTNGGSLPLGSVTYRIYVDMAEGYSLETVFGSSVHDFVMSTSTEFYNTNLFGSTTGGNLNSAALGFNCTALDSYLTFGGATSEHLGIIKEMDTDGSIVGGTNNDGGSESTAGGLLVNDDITAGIPLIVSDGLITGSPASTVMVGDFQDLASSYFGTTNAAGTFTSVNGAIAVLGGLEGIGDENQLLIAQITTDGTFSFSINFRLSTPDGGYEQYVHSNPQEISGSDGQMELTCADLTYVDSPLSALNEFSLYDQVSLYPNPSNGESIFLSLGEIPSQLEGVNVRVSDISGRQLLSVRLTSLNRDVPSELRFDTPLLSGIYLVELAFEDYSISKRLVVQH